VNGMCGPSFLSVFRASNHTLCPHGHRRWSYCHIHDAYPITYRFNTGISHCMMITPNSRTSTSLNRATKPIPLPPPLMPRSHRYQKSNNDLYHSIVLCVYLSCLLFFSFLGRTSCNHHLLRIYCTHYYTDIGLICLLSFSRVLWLGTFSV